MGLGHRIFTRPPSSDPKTKTYTPIEQALDAILSELGDASTVVEYWTRQEWRSIEAHADVDEFLAKRQDADGVVESTSTSSPDFRYPNSGHVLYLKVGSQVRGPTCLFPGRRSGGDLLLAPTSTATTKSSSPKDDTTTTTPTGIELVTVPAVNGRLLRFEGDTLHAVPRPADLWLLKYVQGAPQYEPEEEWGRSVILFNTWDEAPLDVPRHSKEEESLDDEDEELSTCASKDDSIKTVPSRESWALTFEAVVHDSPVEERNDGDAEETVSAKIWLLGNARRRAHAMRTLKLSAPARLVDALQSPTQVSHMMLRPLE